MAIDSTGAATICWQNHQCRGMAVDSRVQGYGKGQPLQLKIIFQHSPLVSTAGLLVITRHFLKNSKLFCPNGLARMSATCC